MIKHTLTAAALVAVLTTSSLAQQSGPSGQTPSASPGGMPQLSGGQKPGFVQSQSPDEWRGSKLIGASVYGPDNQSIGEISDVIVDGSGKVKAAVIGVGGFLGVGQKDVAIPFEALNVTRRQNSASIDKITMSYSKDELKNAPKFVYYEPTGSSQTTGSSNGTSTGGTMNTSPGANR